MTDSQAHDVMIVRQAYQQQPRGIAVMQVKRLVDIGLGERAPASLINGAGANVLEMKLRLHVVQNLQ